MTEYVTLGSLRVALCLQRLIDEEMIPGSGVHAADFWSGLEGIVADLGPRNRALLERRDWLQGRIDEWLKERRGKQISSAEQEGFLADIGYLLPEPEDFSITTANVDPEIASLAGPQLVVPADNARYAINAANARWGSLYDALYGTDVIAEDGGAERADGYNPARGARVFEYASRFLDQAAPLAAGSHTETNQYRVEEGTAPHQLVAVSAGGSARDLRVDARLFRDGHEPAA